MTPTVLLRVRTVEELLAGRRDVLDDATMTTARAIVDAVARNGEPALLDAARRLGDWDGRARWWFDRDACEQAVGEIPASVRDDLETATRQVTAFARAQRQTLGSLDVRVPGGRAGHAIVPIERAGCYAPAGRFPLPSSIIMTVATARAAGVAEVWVATPRPSTAVLATAAIAGADGLLAIGGAQAIAALAHGAGPVPPCDAVVGPGNRWVTAAKQCVAGRVAIDSLAGPSELVVLADETADPLLIAADLLAQAEHDPDAMPVVVTTEASLVSRVEGELRRQLRDLPTAAIATGALARGGVVICPDLDAAIAAVDRLAPEHLQLAVRAAGTVATRVRHAGAIFVGERAAEVFGDYAVGPNHVLPTGGGARSAAGLSVFTFLRVRTWLEIDQPGQIVAATARLARLEGLEGHARAAELRLTGGEG